MAQPPRCQVCSFGLNDVPPGEDFRAYLTPVHFKPTPEQLEHQERMRHIPPIQQFTGHDPTKYFCRRHAPLALERQHLHTAEALTEILKLTAAEDPDL